MPFHPNTYTHTTQTCSPVVSSFRKGHSSDPILIHPWKQTFSWCLPTTAAVAFIVVRMTIHIRTPILGPNTPQTFSQRVYGYFSSLMISMYLYESRKRYSSRAERQKPSDIPSLAAAARDDWCYGRKTKEKSISGSLGLIRLSTAGRYDDGNAW